MGQSGQISVAEGWRWRVKIGGGTLVVTVSQSSISQAAVVRLSSREEQQTGQEYHLEGKSGF